MPTVEPAVLKALIECLVDLDKVSRDRLAQSLGYAGGHGNGKRDLGRVVAGTSTKATVEEAYNKFLVAFPRDVAALRRLSIRLKAKGVSLNAQSACVGYCGKNGSRDMTAVFEKSSRTATPAEAYERLLKKFYRRLTPDSTVVKSEAAAPAKATKKTSDAAAPAKDTKKTSDAAAPAPDAKKKLRKAFERNNEAALRELSRRLVCRGVSLNVQTKWLGYSGKNGSRDIKMVFSGKGWIITRDKAFETLWVQLATIAN